MKSQRFGSCFVNVDVYPSYQREYLVFHRSVTLTCAKYFSDAVCAKKALRRRLILCMTINLLLHVSI